MIRYFFNTQTGQFIQIANTKGKAFNDDWVEITKTAFEYLMALKQHQTKSNQL